MNAEQLLELVPHVDRLNSWVRSKTFALSWSGRRLIYHFKGRVIRDAVTIGAAVCRPVWSATTCRDCGGSRRYTDWSGYTHPHCRRCSSTGSVRLEFIETEIAGVRWHTPRESAWPAFWSLSEFDFTRAPQALDWHPHADGIDLQLDDAIASLLVLERSDLEKPGRRWQGAEDWGGYVDDFAEYTIRIGRTDERACSLCGGAADPGGWFGATLGRVEWTANACKVCSSLWGPIIFQKLKDAGPPHALITPNVAEWISTHPANRKNSQ